MGGVSRGEGDAFEATHVNSDAGFYVVEVSRSTVAAIDSEKGNGVGVGVFDLMRQEVNNQNLTSKAENQNGRCRV